MSVLTLRRFLQSPPSGEAPDPGRAVERCEFCGEPLPSEHGHVVSLESRALACACRACHLLFLPEGAAAGKYRAVPDRYRLLSGPVFTQAQWDQLQIPVGMAFFFHNSSLGRAVAFYPSPAGATESLLALDAWADVVRQNPPLATLAPDVEALLARRRAAGFEGFIAPIDACYELVGRIRLTWKGFDGGEEAHREIEAFFSGLRARSGEAGEAAPELP
jgi:hypothetical protein